MDDTDCLFAPTASHDSERKIPLGQELCAVCREADLQVMAQKSNAEACGARASKTEISGFCFNW